MKFSREFKTGILVIAASVILILGYNFLKGTSLFKEERIFFVKYDNVEGLMPEASVTVNGLQVGKVKQIFISEESRDVTVSFMVDSPNFHFSKTSEIQLYNPGLIGGKALAVFPDYDNLQMAKAGDTLIGIMEKGMMEIVADKVIPLGDDLGNTIARLDTLLMGLNEVMDEKGKEHLRSSFENIDDTMASLSKATTSINTLLEANNKKISTSIDNFEKTSNNLVRISDSLATLDTQKLVYEIEQTIAGLNNVVNKLENGEGSIGKLLEDDNLYQNLEGASKELEELMRDIKLNPKRYVHFSIFGKRNKEYSPEE